MKVKIKAPQGSLNEAGQGNPVAKFAVINANGETLTPFFQCRDYVTDMLWCYYTKKSINVHGYSCDGSEHKDLFKEGIFGLAFKVQNKTAGKKEDTIITDEQFEGVKDLVNKFQEALKFKKSEITLSDDKVYIILFVDPEWTKVPYVASALLLLVRMGLTNDPKEDFIEQFGTGKGKKFISPYDAGYFKSSKHIFEKLLKGEIDKSQKYSDYGGGYEVHDNLGIAHWGQTHKK